MAAAHLRARRKDLKNQLPEIITFSEEQLRAVSEQAWSLLLLNSPPSFHTSTLILAETTLTEAPLLVFKLSVCVLSVCFFFLFFFTCGVVILSATGTCFSLLEKFTCSSTPVYALPTSAVIASAPQVDYAPLGQLREGAL